MSVDLKKFAKFYFKMDYEGGLGSLFGYGYDGDKGDKELNRLYDKARDAFQECEDYINVIVTSYQDEIEKIAEEEMY